MTPRMLWSMLYMIKIFQERSDYQSMFVYPQIIAHHFYIPIVRMRSGWKTGYTKIASAFESFLSNEVQ